MVKSLTDIHYRAITEFDTIQAAVKDEREQSLEDRRFYSIAGAQWEGPLSEQFENKPKFEVNKIHLSVIRIINEYRNNRVTVDFTPKDNKEDDLADACDSLYRADEQDSDAMEAYDNAFEEAVGGGIGAWRLRAEYEDEEDEEDDRQRIKIEPIFDADSCVFFDLNAKRQDKSDAKHCFVLTGMSYEAFEAEYPDEDPTNWSKTVESTEFDWSTPKTVYIAEYYVVEDCRDTIRVFLNLDETETTYRNKDFKHNPELEQELKDVGAIEIRTKKVKTKRVRKYVMSGSKILEKPVYIAGKNIPIVPIYGKRWIVDNVERAMGHVRLSKDVQRLKNMQVSKLAEYAALDTREKPILTPEQIAGHETMWAEDNIKNYPFLLINPITDADGVALNQGPVSYTKPSTLPQSMAALLQLTDVDMKEILGSAQVGDEMSSNMSGKAVELIQTRLDMQTFIYMSNFAKGMKRGGQIWLSMAQDLYVEENRMMKTVDDNDSASTVELMKPMIDDKGNVFHENDLSKAKFDVNVDVGPLSSSSRAATVRAVTGMMGLTQDPADQSVMSAIAMMNMEGEGISDVREYYRKKLVGLEVLEPNEEDQERMQAQQEAAAQQTDPNAEFLKAAAIKETADAELKKVTAIKVAADADKIIEQTKLTKAQTLETLSGIENSNVKTMTEAMNTVSAQPFQ